MSEPKPTSVERPVQLQPRFTRRQLSQTSQQSSTSSEHSTKHAKGYSGRPKTRVSFSLGTPRSKQCDTTQRYSWKEWEDVPRARMRSRPHNQRAFAKHIRAVLPLGYLAGLCATLLCLFEMFILYAMYSPHASELLCRHISFQVAQRYDVIQINYSHEL